MTEYTLTRSKRKSIALYIRDGKLSVRAPMKTDIKNIEAFINSKTSWIEKKLRESAQRQRKYADVFAGQAFLYLGDRLQVQKCAKKSLSATETTLYVPEKYYCGEQLQTTDRFLHDIQLFYKRLAKRFLQARLQRLSEYTGAAYTHFALTNAVTKWGSCDTQNRIRLNWHLILLPESLIDYVIIHELMHTVEHNHSRRFWNCVAKIYPSYKEAVKSLKEEGLLIKLWALKS